MVLRRYHFNVHGSYLGYIDEVGRYFLSDGTQSARLEEDGTMRDLAGRRCGRVDAQGRYWDAQGNYCGYFRCPIPDPSSSHADC